jgi:hypothetical protein
MFGIVGTTLGILGLILLGGHGWLPVTFAIIILLSGLSGLVACFAMRRSGVRWTDGF